MIGRIRHAVFLTLSTVNENIYLRLQMSSLTPDAVQSNDWYSTNSPLSQQNGTQVGFMVTSVETFQYERRTWGGWGFPRFTVALHLILLFYMTNLWADVISPFAVTLTLCVLIHRVPIVWVKAVPLQAWGGPKGSRKLRFPDFFKTAQSQSIGIRVANVVRICSLIIT
jgi:hypothetical protein